MAITPQEAYAIPEEEKRILAASEANIDAALRDRAADGNFGGAIWVSVDGLKPRMREALMLRYRRAGWSVEYKSDQRDGSALVFTPAPTRQVEQER